MKKIAVNTVKNFLKENKHDDIFTQTFEVGESSFDVTIRTNLSIAEKSVFPICSGRAALSAALRFTFFKGERSLLLRAYRAAAIL